MNNDFAVGLRDIASRHEEGLVAQILRTGEKHAKYKESSWEWLARMKVLTLRDRSGSGSSGSIISPIKPSYRDEWLEMIDITDITDIRSYVALSYVWTPSFYEDDSRFTWQVRTSESGIRNAEVRDTVLDRVSRYMKHYSVEYLWVDKECINQKNEEEKMQAMQAMDKVYSMSDWPLAVLFVPVRTPRELELLADLMRGCFTRQASKRKQGQCDGDLSLDPSLDEAGQYEILDLLYRLTSDPWWSRAWCFQEEYLAGRQMKLLIPHFLGPSAQIDEVIFGKLTTSGDLILSSYEFRTEATMFVLAYVCTAKRKQERFDQGICRQVLTIAGKYTLLAKHGRHLDLDVRGKSMSTLVLSDLGRKHYTLPSDILNIAANCNLYPQVMNTTSLDKLGDSLSIATLTMWFLNGEIFRNNDLGGPTNNNTARRVNQNVFQYLHSIAFDDCPPFGEQGRLTYRRKFRFLNPKLTKMGIDTSGHLFGISRIIELDTDVLEGSETEVVLSLVAKEVRRTHAKLAVRLDRFIRQEFNDATYASRRAMSLSAKNLVLHLREKPYVGVGSLIRRTEGKRDSIDAGIFALDNPVTSQQPGYVFVSWQEGSGRIPQYKNQPEEDKYVSLKVSVTDQSIDTASPLLRTEAWTDSLCFYARARPHS